MYPVVNSSFAHPTKMGSDRYDGKIWVQSTVVVVVKWVIDEVGEIYELQKDHIVHLLDGFQTKYILVYHTDSTIIWLCSFVRNDGNILCHR